MFDWFFGPEFEFSRLGMDMHAHWLPGIDDGARTMEQALGMIRGMVDRGYSHLIGTPHIMSDYYGNTPSIIRSRLADVRSECERQGINVRLDAAAEYLLDDGFEDHLAGHQAMTLPGNRLLIEFGFYHPPANATAVIFRLRTAGYRVVLAHPERYPYYHSDTSFLDTFTEQGGELQVNLLSLVGHYGPAVRKQAIRLIRAGQVSFLGTDAHRIEHVQSLSKLQSKRAVRKLLAASRFANQQLINS